MSLGLLALLLRSTHLEAVGQSLSRVSVAGLVLAFLVLLLAVMAAGLVWWLVLPAAGGGVGRGTAMRATIVGFAFNSVVPLSGLVGDLYRGVVLVQQRIPPLPVAFSLLAARWFTLLALALALWLDLALVLRWWPERELAATVPIRLGQLTLVSALSASGLCLAFTAALLVPAGLLYCLRPFLGRAEVWLPEVRGMIGQLARSHGRLSGALALSLLCLLLEGVSLYAVVRALGCPGEALPFLFLAPLIRILHQVPGFVNGVGIQEAAAVMVGPAFGISWEDSLSLSLLVHVLRLAVAVLGLALFVRTPLEASVTRSLLSGGMALSPVELDEGAVLNASSRF